MQEAFTYFSLISENHGFIYLAHLLLVVAIVLVISFLATKSMKIVPGVMQNIMEAYVQGVHTIGGNTMSEEKVARYVPLIGTIGLLVLLSNLIGIIPGFESPSAFLDFTLGLTIVVFIYYHMEGIRVNGAWGYIKHFAGPVPALAPLMFPIEIISHFSRVISLSFRLFGNIKGDDLFLAVVLMLAPIVLPMAPMIMLFIMAFLQTFVFMILSFVYISGAVMISEDH
jgi:F-type H+-transporting ATPase subunit a